MIRAVIFDLDRTLFDRRATLRALAPEMRKSFKIKSGVSDSEIGDKWVYADDRFIYIGWKYIYEYLVESGIFEEPPSFDDYRSFVYKYFARVAVAFPCAAPMLDSLHTAGYKTGLITNGGHFLQYRKLELLSLTDKLDEIIVSGDVGTDKPDRDIFMLMCDKLSLPPDEMVYIGDNPKDDIYGAKKAGYKTIWMNTAAFCSGEAVPADFSVTELSQVLGAVKALDKKQEGLLWKN